MDVRPQVNGFTAWFVKRQTESGRKSREAMETSYNGECAAPMYAFTKQGETHAGETVSDWGTVELGSRKVRRW
jgi:hypothetical protein